MNFNLFMFAHQLAPSRNTDRAAGNCMIACHCARNRLGLLTAVTTGRSLERLQSTDRCWSLLTFHPTDRRNSESISSHIYSSQHLSGSQSESSTFLSLHLCLSFFLCLFLSNFLVYVYSSLFLSLSFSLSSSLLFLRLLFSLSLPYFSLFTSSILYLPFPYLVVVFLPIPLVCVTARFLPW